MTGHPAAGIGFADRSRQTADVATPLHNLAVRRTSRSSWREYPPSDEAGHAQDCTWTGIGGFRHSIMLVPDGCLDIVWNGARLSASLPAAYGVRRRVEATSVNVGIRVRCGWAGAFLGSALVDFRGAETDLGIAWGAFGEHAMARLRAAEEPAAIRAVLEALLAERLADAAAPSAVALESIWHLRAEPNLSVQALRRRLGASERTVRRQIAAATGLSPKGLQRVFRFQAMRRRLESAAPSDSAAVIAAELGFADQPHMTRECRAMTGRTPAELRRRTSGGRNLQDRPRSR